MSQDKILIVGAGPTGLTAAIELARRGIIPKIIDKRDAASTLSRAVGITPRSLELLSHAGVSPRLIAEGVAMEGLCVYRADKLSLEMPLNSNRTYYPTIFGLPQDRTEAIMLTVLKSLGSKVNYSLGLERMSEEDNKLITTFSDGTKERFDRVIGADGVHSTVRESAGIPYIGFDLPQIWSIADVDVANWRHPGKITLVQSGPGTVLVVAPMGGSRYRVVASCEDALKALPIPFDVSEIHRESTFSISVRQAATYSRSNIHLAGDAAHCHSPVGGRGMNLGIADAAELAKRLSNGSVEDYSAARHEIGAKAMAMTERGRRMIGALRGKAG